MFTDGQMAQELAALLIALLAALYVLKKLTGWPRFGKKPRPPEAGVTLGSRLARGLRSARKKR